ncbi:MAG: hypothetical protein IJB53_08060 [Mailhella sp.]|nr:hypothetical protein [Mailhella sp.]
MGYYLFLGRFGNRPGLPLGWLFLASLFYYAYWEPKNIFIIICSLFVNYFLAGAISSAQKARKPLFLLGLLLNLGALAYYKYTAFYIDSLNSHSHWGGGTPVAGHSPAHRHFVLHLSADSLPF